MESENGKWEKAALLCTRQGGQSLNIVARALAKTDRADVQPVDYICMGLALAKQGLDTEPIARNYINEYRTRGQAPAAAAKP